MERWPSADFTRVPFAVHVDPQIFELEQDRIFRGPTWNYLGLEAELPNAGDFVTGYVGATPVVLNRGKDGELHAHLPTGANYLLVHSDNEGNSRIFCVGEYRDRIVESNGSLRFRERRVIADTFTVASHISMPI